MPWFLFLPMQESLAKGWAARDGCGSGTWKVYDFMKQDDWINRGTV